MNIERLHRLSTPPHVQSQRRRRRVARRALPCIEEMEDRCVLSTLTVNGSQSLQTIAGFGTNLSSEAWNSGAVTPSLDTLLSHGYKLFRVIVEPVQGWEDTNPNTGQYSDSNPNWAVLQQSLRDLDQVHQPVEHDQLPE